MSWRRPLQHVWVLGWYLPGNHFWKTKGKKKHDYSANKLFWLNAEHFRFNIKILYFNPTQLASVSLSVYAGYPTSLAEGRLHFN